MSTELYAAWLFKYSPAGNPIEALSVVRRKEEELLREGKPRLELRVAALERFTAVWTEFMASMFFVDELRDFPSEHIVARSVMACEFIRLAALVDAIELDRLANERTEEE